MQKYLNIVSCENGSISIPTLKLTLGPQKSNNTETAQDRLNY